jgi:hypothetical protein
MEKDFKISTLSEGLRQYADIIDILEKRGYKKQIGIFSYAKEIFSKSNGETLDYYITFNIQESGYIQNHFESRYKYAGSTNVDKKIRHLNLNRFEENLSEIE